jgi:transcriptional regulator with XRE-family HTH domain
MDTQPTTIGERLRSVRKRRGLTQRALAETAGLSLSLIKKLEQGERADIRLETARKLAVALRVPTSAIMPGHEPAEEARPDITQTWEPVRRALAGEHPGEEPEEEPTADGLDHAFDLAVADVVDNRYTDLRLMLPALLRDADALVTISVNGTETQARHLRSQIRQLTAYMMSQTRQFTAADDAIEMAAADADDDLTAMAAADWKSWILIRQGHLDDAKALAVRWADDSEPRVSRASADEFTAWGRFQLRITAAAMRDNRPDEAAEALRLARIAASGIARDIIPSFNRWQVFGPMTVAMFQAQNALIQNRPEVTLRIGRQLEGRSFPLPETWNRHRLDVANAHAITRDYTGAVTVLRDIQRNAPEWLAQQRYARDILSQIIGKRRTLTPGMRQLADAVRLPL